MQVVNFNYSINITNNLFYRLFTRFPISGTYFSMQICILKCLYQSQSFIYTSAHWQVIHCDLSENTFIIYYKQSPKNRCKQNKNNFSVSIICLINTLMNDQHRSNKHHNLWIFYESCLTTAGLKDYPNLHLFAVCSPKPNV